MKRTTTRWKVGAGAAILALLVTACGDDDDDTATATTEDPNAEYCALAEELDEQEELFTAEQLEQLRDASPEEIREEVEAVVPILIEGIEAGDPFAAFEDPVVEENIEVIETFEAEVCGLGDDESDDEEEPEQDPSVTEPDASAAQVAVTATEYAFAFAPEPAAGRTQFTMTNAGEERHVMLLFRIADGATMDTVLESEGEEGIEGPELESDSAAAGETAVLTTDLEPGSYGMICYIPDADGTPHLALGMVKEFTVQ